MKRRTLTTMALVCCLGFAKAADNLQYLTFYAPDGTVIQSLTAVGLTITFDGSNMTATNAATAESAVISLSQLSRMLFSASNDTGISNVSNDAADLTLNDADTIYDLAGRQIPKNCRLQKGVYIIRKGSLTKKIQVK